MNLTSFERPPRGPAKARPRRAVGPRPAILLLIAACAVGPGILAACAASGKAESAAVGAASSPSPIYLDASKAGLWDRVVEGDLVRVEGRVRRVGGEPFTYLVVTDAESKDWQPDGEGQGALAGFEQYLVAVEGRVSIKRMVLANGKELPARRMLAEVKVTKSWRDDALE